ncbi:hypothetical protein STEG23_034975 [Scotinomys teguina]
MKTRCKSYRVGKFLYDGPPQKRLPTENSLQRVMHGAMALSCGRPMDKAQFAMTVTERKMPNIAVAQD